MDRLRIHDGRLDLPGTWLRVPPPLDCLKKLGSTGRNCLMALSLSRRLSGVAAAFAAVALTAVLFMSEPAHAQQKPIKIGFSMSLTGPLGAGGKSSLIAMEIWRDDINAKGGLLGRPVEFVYYDDQTNP